MNLADAARLFALLGLVAFVPVVRAGEEKVPLKDVPMAVLDAVKARFPAAELKEAARETEDGRTTYEVALKQAGKAVDVALTAEGEITEVETELAAKDLPKAVASAIETKFPKSTIKGAEEIVEFEGDKQTRSFEVLLETGARKPVEVKLSPEGKIVKEEEDDES